MNKKQPPQPVLDAAKGLIKMFGQRLEYLGDFQGSEVWQFVYPEDKMLGLPRIFLFNNSRALLLNGWESLKIINRLLPEEL